MALRLKADFAEALSGRAAAQLQRRNWDLALADLERALKIDSARGAGLRSAGGGPTASDASGIRAIADFTRAIALGERTALTYIYRGAAYDAKYDYDRAIADYGEALRLEPSNVRAIAARGLAHFNKGNLDAAAFDLSETLKREPTNEVALLTRAMVYSAKGEQARAIGDLDALLRRDAKNASAYVQRGYRSPEASRTRPRHSCRSDASCGLGRQYARWSSPTPTISVRLRASRRSKRTPPSPTSAKPYGLPAAAPGLFRARPGLRQAQRTHFWPSTISAKPFACSRPLPPIAIVACCILKPRAMTAPLPISMKR
jgi:hypothetical protein